MTECQICGTALKKEWAVRLAEGNEYKRAGPLYFCSEDHREEYRQHYYCLGLEKQKRPDNFDGEATTVEYGDEL